EFAYPLAELQLLADVESVEKHHRRRRRGLLADGVHEPGGECLAAFKGNLYRLDPRPVDALGISTEALDGITIDGERGLILGQAKAFAHLVVAAGAQIGFGRGQLVAGAILLNGNGLSLIAGPTPFIEPGFV